MSKERLDQKLLELGLFDSRQQAQAAIMDGGIIVDGQKITKAGFQVGPGAKIEVTAEWQPQKYVSRGGLKLEKALSEFRIDVTGRICLDIGASTGGFTDCLLKHGAAKVYAIDVGYGQIAWSLRTDPRVILKERVNARSLSAQDLYNKDDQWSDFACFDVSFISLTKVLPAVIELLAKPKFDLVCLIKPQFEAGKDAVGKGGVVKSKDVQIEIIERVFKEAGELALIAKQLTFSPLKGPAGNIEFLAQFTQEPPADKPDIASVVEDAHASL